MVSRVVCVVGCCVGTALGAPSFTPLGTLNASGGGTLLSQATGISGDGAVVVGTSGFGTGSKGFRWTGGVMNALEPLPGDASSLCYGVSRDGTTAVGSSRLDAFTSGAVRWIGVNVDDLAAGPGAFATAASSNGSIVYGARDSIAWRWVGNGVDDLGDLASASSDAVTGGCSDDGSVLVGSGSYDAGGFETGFQAFSWKNSVFTVLPDMIGGVVEADAVACSANGAIVVGSGSPGTSLYTRATRWTVTGAGASAPQDLGDLAGGIDLSKALAVSGDGSVVVGYAAASDTVGGPSLLRAFIWDAGNGMRRLDSVFESLGGVLPANWQLERATAISSDGLTIAGTGRNAQGKTEGFVLSLAGGVPPCGADLDDGSGSGTRDGAVTIEDLLFFLTHFEAGDVPADLDDGSGLGVHDGAVTIEDLLFFLAHYEQGC